MSLVEEDSRKLDRTWLCSVLFLDIVNYSSQLVETQVKWKAFFNACLSEALVSVLPSDRIILDTGDGAVVCFLGDPETALLCSLSILNQYRAEAQSSGPVASVRVGINLGPIRLIRDINSQLNAVGDGINVGQRIMSFAAGNQLLISRSYYEVISTLSANYKDLFRFDGVRHDKHIREHTVYALVEEPGTQPDAMESTSGGMAAPSLEAPASIPFRSEDIAAIEKNLSAFVGPIARHLVKKACSDTGDLSRVCDVLESAVPVADRAKFLSQCRSIVGGSAQTTQSSVAEQVKSTTALVAAPPAKEWDTKFLEKVRKDLAEYLGPIATILVSRAAKSAQSQDEIYTSLAQQINSEQERKKFLARRS